MKDHHEYRYVILDTEGRCWRITDGGTEKEAGLPSLLAGGWRPVRETPYHEVPYVLILLERDDRDDGGFGFST